MATLVLGGVGALIGSSIGGPAGARLGFSIGAMLGGFLEGQNTPKYDVGKLNDLRYSGSSYGANLPRIWGKARVAGNVIWVATDSNGNHLKERSKKISSGGTGGGSSGREYWYLATMAIEFCQGSMFFPDPSQSDGGDIRSRNPILKRLWADDVLVWEDGGSNNIVDLEWHSGSESQSPDSTVVAASGVASSQVPAYRGRAYCVITDMNLKEFANRIPNFSAEIHTDDVTVGEVVSDLCRSVGILSAEIDADSADTPLTGFVELSRSTAQSSIDQLSGAFGFDAVEVDGLIRLVPRGGASIATVPYSDLGAGLEVGTGIHLERTLPSMSEKPGRVDFVFNDSTNSYQQATQFDIRQFSSIANISTIYTGLSMTPDEGRAAASRLLDESWIESVSYSLSLPPRYLNLAPGDPFQVDAPTGPLRMRVVSALLAPVGVLQINAVRDDASVLIQNPPGGGDGGGSTQLPIVPSVFDAWSGIELMDEHRNAPGFYIVATGGSEWQGCEVWYSLDGGGEWILGPEIGARSVFGVTLSALSDSGAVADTFDNANDVQVNVGASGGVLESATDEQILQQENHAVLGGEILGFGGAVLDAPGVYTLSHLRRGERGSVMSGHLSGERFVLLSPDVARVDVNEAFIGETVKVKCVSPGEVLGDVVALDVVIAAPSETELGGLLNTAVFPQLLASPQPILAETASTLSETTYDLSSWVNSKARVAMLSVYGGHETPDGDEPLLEWRVNGSDTWKPLFRVKASGSGDRVKFVAYPMVNLTNSKEFRLRIATAFSMGVQVDLVGYFG